jgi:hypothetical protein
MGADGEPQDAVAPADQPRRRSGSAMSGSHRIYVPGRLLTDDTIDEIATEIAAALRRRRQHER